MPEIDADHFDYGGVRTGPVKHSIAGWLAANGIVGRLFAGVDALKERRS